MDQDDACVGVCMIEDGRCVGCGRTEDEIYGTPADPPVVAPPGEEG